jgi:hypothetical protein
MNYLKISALSVNKAWQGRRFKTISWADAWTALMTVYPEATYEVVKDIDTNLPYFGSDIGFMVETKITI